jgi:hypothetical protein
MTSGGTDVDINPLRTEIATFYSALVATRGGVEKTDLRQLNAVEDELMVFPFSFVDPQVELCLKFKGMVRQVNK